MVVAVAALAGAAIGWRFPFLGRNRSANQLETAQQPSSAQPVNRARTLRAIAGTLVVRNEQQMKILLDLGPITVLRNVAVPT